MNHRPEHAVVIETYREFRDDIRAFAEGKFNFLLVVSTNGLGKSETTREMLKGHCVFFEGSPSPWGFYCELCDHANMTVVLDDVNPKFFKDPKSNAYVKSLTDTREVKTLRWQTASTGCDKGYPSAFQTTSRVVLLTNSWESINEHVKALEGRAFTVIFEPTPTEVHLEVGRRGWFTDEEVYEFVWRHRHLVTRPNMRLYKKIAEQKAAGRPWRKRGLEMLIGDARLSRVAELLTDPKYPSNRQRAEAFSRMGLGGRTLYYELLREFRYYKTDDMEADCPKLADFRNGH